MSNTSPTFKEAKRLYRMGFAIHWLHPMSKRPIGNAWATGPRKSWDELKASHQSDFNVGVRLGDASKLEKGYLCVIDVDIKSEEKRHRVEAVAALRKLIGETICPEVRSGRGNGSRHLYCVTENAFKTWNPAESVDEVKVMMPSKSPSKRELRDLSEAEIREGWRLSRAWEISLYSNGRQVVLPPSIHPDTKKPYYWRSALENVTSLPLLNFGEAPETDSSGVVKERKPQEFIADFEIDETLDIRWLPGITEAMRDLIVEGIWKGREVNRSDYLPFAAQALFSSGLDKNGVLTVLTDQTTFLGECAYDHAKTSSRKRAAQWLWNYTVKKVMEDRDPTKAFEGIALVMPKHLDEDARDLQLAALNEDDPSAWERDLDKTKEGLIRATLTNCKKMIQNVCPEKEVVGRDEFAVNDFYLCDAPWRSKKGDAVNDMDIVRIKHYLAERFRVEFGDHTINQALLEIADRNRFHPVRAHIEGLSWDGEPRLENWLSQFAQAKGPEAYLKAVSRKVVVAMIKRVFEPGCKFDQVLILEGLQGVGKSRLLRVLGGQWFTDQPLNIGDKDAVLTMQSKWIIELGELASLNRSELETFKAFVTQQTDRIRAPYGKRVEEYPRQCIFIGTTNLDEYLKDETGARRFWPVNCREAREIDVEGFAAVRDQILAEAYAYYQLGEPLYLETRELVELAKSEQAKRGESDEITNSVVAILKGDLFPRGGFEMKQLASMLDQFGVHRLEKADQMRLAKVLTLLGCEKYRENDGQRRRLWRAKTFMDPARPTSSHLGGTKNHQ